MVQLNLGDVLMSASVADAVAKNALFARLVNTALHRHKAHDWGDLEDEDKITNDEALVFNLRILSSYNVPNKAFSLDDDKIWIITEADRSVTTILFPSDY